MPRLTRDFAQTEPGLANGTYYEVDFTGNIPEGYTLVDAPWQLSVDSVDSGAAADTDPNSRLDGSASVNASFSTQKIVNLVAGNTYLVGVAGVMQDANDPPNSVAVLLWGLLPCRSPGQAALDYVDKRQRLAELIAARDTGALSVRHGDEFTTYRSLAEINQIIGALEDELGATTTTNAPLKRVRMIFGKGL